MSHYQVAEEMLEELGVKPEATRVRAHVAVLLASQGHLAEAKRRLRQTIAEFENFEMRVDAVISGISLAEVLLVEDEFQEVVVLCERAIEQFRASGASKMSEALVALTYLQEAARQKRATVAVARHVKKYLEQIPTRPNLLFAPPPLAPE